MGRRVGALDRRVGALVADGVLRAGSRSESLEEQKKIQKLRKAISQKLLTCERADGRWEGGGNGHSGRAFNAG